MGKRRFERHLEAFDALREPTRRRLYEHVGRQPEPVSRDEAARAVGVNRALAAFHLDKLVELGLLTAEYRRLSGKSGPGAGRTSKLYVRSRHQFDLSLPRREHQLLARLLAESHASAAADRLAAVEPARDYGRSLGARARKRIPGRPGNDRLVRCVEDVLQNLGFEPYRAHSREIRLRSCPFDPLCRLFAQVVCGVGQALISGIVEGMGADEMSAGRDERPHPDRCCGVVRLGVELPAGVAASS